MRETEKGEECCEGERMKRRSRKIKKEYGEVNGI